VAVAVTVGVLFARSKIQKQFKLQSEFVRVLGKVSRRREKVQRQR